MYYTDFHKRLITLTLLAFISVYIFQKPIFEDQYPNTDDKFNCLLDTLGIADPVKLEMLRQRHNSNSNHQR